MKMASTTTESSTEKVTESMKGLVISASGIIPGYPHDRIKKMVEECGAKFTTMNLERCTHLVTTRFNVKRRLKKITEAREQGDCNIVSIDWLLRCKEKRTPVNVEEYLIAPSTETSANKLEKDVAKLEKKRARDVSLAADDYSSLKKQKTQHPPSQYLIDLVHKEYPKSTRNTLSVWRDTNGVVWDATLVNHKPEEERILNVLCIQLLMCQETQRFHTWIFEYQIGSSRESKSIGAFGSLDSAKQAFETRFEKSSGLAWKDRHELPLEDKWIFLESHHGNQISTTQVDTSISVGKVLGVILSPELLQYSYDEFLKRLSCRYRPDDKAQEELCSIGVAILRRLTTLTGGIKAQEEFKCSIGVAVLRRIPTSADRIKANKVRLCEERLLRTWNILASEDDIVLITMDWRVIAVFRVERSGEAQSFARWEEQHRSKIGDRRLLWHGSTNSKFSSILREGLKADRLKRHDGSMFFAEMSTKSAGYCERKGEALLLLCEVELGNSGCLSNEERGCKYYKTWRDAGDIHPALKHAKVPDFDSEASTPSGLFHSEFIVRNPAQIRLRYLFHVVMGRKCGL
ncbi:hypothetical protein N7461_008699 [Penicillium sp. DV-2018c]|nr:hypothetical protein N7461_008699 [Penicillium sp. DV-2018c]